MNIEPNIMYAKQVGTAALQNFIFTTDHVACGACAIVARGYD